MKKTIALLLALILLVSLTACKKAEQTADAPLSNLVPESQNAASGDAAQNGTSEAEPQTPAAPEPEPDRIATPEELRGSWTLSPDNDAAQLETAFPGVTESGGTMEIGADGLLFWFIGTAGGAGSFTMDGDTLNCQLVSDHNGVAEPVAIEFDRGGPTLIMEYNGVSVVWDKVIPPR